jgi:mono/diheme cytochrome c family protein
MRSPVPAAVLLIAAVALAACTAERVESRGTTPIAPGESTDTGRPGPAAGGVMRWGDSFAMMSQQYVPRAGAVSATGASAWVRPAPAPAFVASGPPPPADQPAPPPAAVANRQPAAPAAGAARPATPASEITRPEAAAPDAPAPATPNPALRAAGLALFNTYSCGTCHAFADAGAAGSIGPSLDRNPRLTREFAVDVIGTGRGAMPSFAGQMSVAEIAALANYLVEFSRK